MRGYVLEDGSGVLAAVDEVAGGVQIAMDVVVEIKGSEKPACVAQTLSRLYR